MKIIPTTMLLLAVCLLTQCGPEVTDTRIVALRQRVAIEDAEISEIYEDVNMKKANHAADLIRANTNNVLPPSPANLNRLIRDFNSVRSRFTTEQQKKFPAIPYEGSTTVSP